MRSLREFNSNSDEAEPNNVDTKEFKLGSLDSNTFTTSIIRSPKESRLSVDDVSLNKYFHLVRQAIVVTLTARLSLCSLFIILVLRKYRSR